MSKPAKQTKAAPARHACFDAIDAQLKEHNARLAFALVYGLDEGPTQLKARLMVSTEKLDKSKRQRRSIPAVVAIHCPFCGTKLTED